MDQINLIQEALTTAQTVLVMLPSQLTLDKVASALELYLSCSKIPKTTTIVCEKKMTVEYAGLVGVDKITDKVGGRSLVVSFDYKEEAIEKVSYNIENERFNLVIQPKDGKLPLEAEKVKYSYIGGEVDVVIKMGGESSLGVGRAKVINLDLGVAASYAEVVAEVLSKLRLPADEDVAQNLLAGLRDATNNLTAEEVNANTFEAAAFCLRLGAKMVKSKNGEKLGLKEQGQVEQSRAEKKESPLAPPVVPQPDWFEPKIYRGGQV